MNLSIDILFFLYKTRVCSVLEYSSFVLMQSTKKIKCSLEVIQNNAIRTILTSFKSTSRPYLHSNSGLLPIAARRDWLHAKYLINLSNKTLNTAFNVVDSLYNSTVACKPSSTPSIIATKRLIAEVGLVLLSQAQPASSPPPQWAHAPAQFLKVTLANKKYYPNLA